jgi:hypothetical protein
MNERIGELYTQALEYTNSVIPPERRYNDIYYAVASAKHAKLIVQECMNTIKQNENASLNISNFTDEKKQGIQLGLEFAITDIAEHFGVEE